MYKSEGIDYSDTISTRRTSSAQQHKYELCVTFKKASYNYNKYNSYSDYQTNEEYSTYVSTYNHPSGEVCYKLIISEY